MHLVFSMLLTLHAAMHVLGFAEAFNLMSFEQLRTPISRPMGMLWLAAAVLLLSAVAALYAAPRWFWLVGAFGLAASQTAIIAAWSDAGFGTIVNTVLLAAVIYAAFAWGPFGLRAEYERLVQRGLAQTMTGTHPQDITEADLAVLPPPVQRYLRFAGVVGTQRARGFRARLTGRIRGAATAPWMPFQAEQHNFYDPPRRYFWMEATRGGLPVEGLHVYDESGASMRIRLVSLVPVVDLGGPDMMRAETVTVFNDMCLFAPGRLLDPSIRWREIDARSVEATYTNGTHTIHAVLLFDDSGALADFWSDDRPALAEDGRTMLPQRWSTPIGDYRAMGPYRLATRGEGRYALPGGEYAYIEIEVHEVSTEIVSGKGNHR
ncbi:MAG: hypothetical protein HPY69_07630 [Armatimonadetes bacterium]|nr:hypothetical protein [Armatimonadota bacterium]